MLLVSSVEDSDFPQMLVKVIILLQQNQTAGTPLEPLLPKPIGKPLVG